MTKFLIFLVVITPLVASSQTNVKKRKAGELVIHGTLSNIKEPISYVYMICFDSNNEGIDSVRVINNKYSFRVQTGVTTLVTLYAKNPVIPDNVKDKYMLALLLEPATVLVSSTDSFPNAKVFGSKAYPEYKKLEARREPYSRQWSTLYDSYLKKTEHGDKEGVVQLQKRMDSSLEKLDKMYYEYIKAHPSSLVVPHALYIYMRRLKSNSSNEDVEKVELIYNKLSKNDKNSFYGKKIKKKLDSYKVSIGMTAPVFVQNDTLGNPVSLTFFKGKYVLLDFWASWCAPCRKENPNVVKAFNAYKDKGFTVLSISLDRPDAKGKWMDAIQKDGLTWTHLSDLQYWDNTVAKLYKINSIPQNFLIDPSGKIIDKGLRGVELEKRLEMILK